MSGWIVIDRIDNGIAACELENREMRLLPVQILPCDVKEGDCLRVRDGRYQLDPVETLRRREANLALLRGLTRSVKEESADREAESPPPEENGFSLK